MALVLFTLESALKVAGKKDGAKNQKAASAETFDDSLEMKVKALIAFIQASIDSHCCNSSAMEYLLAVLCVIIGRNCGHTMLIENQMNKILMTGNDRHAIRFLLGVLNNKHSLIVKAKQRTYKKLTSFTLEKKKEDAMVEYFYKLSGVFVSTSTNKAFEKIGSKDNATESKEVVEKLQAKSNDELLAGAIHLLTVNFALT